MKHPTAYLTEGTRTSLPSLGIRSASLIWLVLLGSVLLGIVGPFGQIDRFSITERIGLWLLYLAIGVPLAALAQAFMYRKFRDFPFWLVGLSTAFLLCAPILLWVEAIGALEGRPLPNSPADWLWSASEVAIVLFGLVMLMGMLSVFSDRTRNSDNDMTEPDAAYASSDGLAGVPVDLVYAACAEGHYARLFTLDGVHFMRMPFSEVLKHLEPLDGIHLHRSWWALRSHISKVRSKGSAGEAVLTNGETIPVSRRKLAAVRSTVKDRPIAAIDRK